MRLLITRPEPDAARTKKLLAARGHPAEVFSVLNIEFLQPSLESLDVAQAILFTSKNAIRALAAERRAQNLPTFVVGEATAEAARTQGFAVSGVAEDNVETLARLVAQHCSPTDGPLVHARGVNVAADLAGRLHRDGYEVVSLVLYRADPVAALPDWVIDALGERLDGVVLFSPRSARTFCALLRDAGRQDLAKRLIAFAFSPAVAAAAGDLKWKRVVSADRPTTAALLKAIDAAGCA